MPSSWKPPRKCAYSTPSRTPVPEHWLERLAAAAGGGEVPAPWREWLAAADQVLITQDSPLYPATLQQIPDAPLALWVAGAVPELLAHPQLAMVGSRRPTQNGRLLAEVLAAEISQAGITVTSGLALGIDAASHRGALAGPAGTIAVLGCGIDQLYPARNRELADRIRADGLIVSEYGPGVPVRAHQFPRRNRIIAGLSIGTLVVEATRRSGSLITARLANEFGREVFAVPGSVYNAQSRGCHKLLRDGAKLVENTADILIEIAPQLGDTSGMTCINGNSTEHTQMPEILANCLDFAPVSFETLLRSSGLTAAELSSMLLHLELQGKIEALPGGRYCRLAKRA